MNNIDFCLFLLILIIHLYEFKLYINIYSYIKLYINIIYSYIKLNIKTKYITWFYMLCYILYHIQFIVSYFPFIHYFYILFIILYITFVSTSSFPYYKKIKSLYLLMMKWKERIRFIYVCEILETIGDK